MTVLWTIIFGMACIFGEVESLELDPVNGWTFTLIAVVALDLIRASD
jgi:hypothetical protein